MPRSGAALVGARRGHRRGGERAWAGAGGGGGGVGVGMGTPGGAGRGGANGAGLEVPKETCWTQPLGCGPPAAWAEQGDAQNFPSLPQDIKSGRSPLIHAVENNSLSMVQLLLQVGTAPLCGLSPTVSSGPDRLSLHPCHRPLLLPALALVLATLPAPTLPPRPLSANPRTSLFQTTNQSRAISHSFL